MDRYFIIYITFFLKQTEKLILVFTCIPEYFFDEHFQEYEININHKNLPCLFHSVLKFCTVTRCVTAKNGKIYIPKCWI